MQLYVKENILFIFTFGYFFSLILFLGIFYNKYRMTKRLNNLVNMQYESEYVIKDQFAFVKSFYKNRLESIQLSLDQAGIKMEISKYLLYYTVITMSAGITTFIFTRSFIVGFLIYIFLTLYINSYIKTKKNRRMNKCTQQLPTVVSLIRGMISTGSSPLKALSDVSSEIDEPLKTEFEQIVKGLNLGLSYSDVFSNLYKRIPSVDMQLFTNAMIIQRETGGNLSQILTRMEQMLIEKENIKAEQKALVAQGKFSAVVLTFMPYGVAVLIWLFNPGFLEPLFSGTGLYILIYGVISSIIGWFIIMKVVKVDI